MVLALPPHLRQVVSAAFAAALVGALPACGSSEPPDPKERIAEWLFEAPRTIAVRVDPILPYPTFETHISTAMDRAEEEAAAGVMGSIEAGLRTGDLYGMAAGLILAPVFAAGGAIYGAVTAEPLKEYHAVELVEGAPALFQAVGDGAELRGLLTEMLAAQSDSRGHELRPVDADETFAYGTVPADADALLTLSVSTLGLVGRVEEDPNVKLILRGLAHMVTRDAGSAYWNDWSYESANRRVSRWRADDARRFREEVARAAEVIARRLAACLPVDENWAPAPPTDKNRMVHAPAC
jgi:hypothetical protein